MRRLSPASAATFAASAAMFLINMDVLIINVALPSIEADLGGGMTAQQWIVDGYTLPFAALLLFAGNLSDRLGAKRVFMFGTAAFAVASTVCTASTSALMLIAGRVLLGIAAALMLPSSMAVINEGNVNARARAHALALWGIGGSAATAVGPILGGLLTPIHWSLVFSINIPLCIAILVISRLIAPSRVRSASFDVYGQVLAVLGLAGVVGGTIEGGSVGFISPMPLSLLVMGAVALAAFVLFQKRSSDPMMPLSLFANGGMRLALLGGFAMILTWNGFIFLCTLFLQQELGLSAFWSGLSFTPAALASVAGNLACDRLSASYTTRSLLKAGCLLMAAGYGALMACSALGLLGPVSIAAGISVAGLGGAFTTPCLANLVLKVAPAGQAGIASAVFNTMRQVGGAVGIALFGVIAGMFPSLGTGLAVSLSLSLGLILALVVVVSLGKDEPVGVDEPRNLGGGVERVE